MYHNSRKRKNPTLHILVAATICGLFVVAAAAPSPADDAPATTATITTTPLPVIGQAVKLAETLFGISSSSSSIDATTLPAPSSSPAGGEAASSFSSTTTNGAAEMPELLATVAASSAASAASALDKLNTTIEGTSVTLDKKLDEILSVLGTDLPVTTIEPITSTEPTSTPIPQPEIKLSSDEAALAVVTSTEGVRSFGINGSTAVVTDHIQRIGVTMRAHDDASASETEKSTENNNIHQYPTFTATSNDVLEDKRTEKPSEDVSGSSSSSSSSSSLAPPTTSGAFPAYVPLADITTSTTTSTTSTTSTTERSSAALEHPTELINQISVENDEEEKDLNNFRHPATLITASNGGGDEASMRANDQLRAAQAAVHAAEERQHERELERELEMEREMHMFHHVVPVPSEDEEQEDPYHVHILSHNHDHLAEHEDYQMLSSTEESNDASSSSSASASLSTSSSTQKSMTNNDVEMSTDRIVISDENRATAGPFVSGSGFIPDGSNDSRGRAMKEDENEGVATTTTRSSMPVIAIVEGQHMHNHDNDHKSIEQVDIAAAMTTTPMPTTSTSASISTTTTQQIPIAEAHPAFEVFAGEGRSAGSSMIVADEDEDNHHGDHMNNYHFNFVTTDRGAVVVQPTEVPEERDLNDGGRNAALMDLSNVSMDDDNNKENETITKTGNEPQVKITEVTLPGAPPSSSTTTTTPDCMSDGKSFTNGETTNRGCQERCTCNRGEWICEPRCQGRSFVRGTLQEQQEQPHQADCREIPVEGDVCCATMECTDVLLTPTVATMDVNAPPSSSSESSVNASAAKMRPDCHYNGIMYKFRERLEIGCEEICHCDDGGIMECKPRCPERNHTRLDKCVYVKDPKDVCCQLELCDVTLDDHEQQSSPPTSQNAINGDDGGNFSSQEEARDINSQTSTSSSTPDTSTSLDGTSCMYKGQSYKLNELVHDGCDQLCVCTPKGIHCAELNCPTFGLDVLNPRCLRWEPEPANFKPIAPNCCPENMRCVDNGTCEYRGQTFDNWSPIPVNLTGCEQHCFCDHGKVECRPACPPVLALPPPDLPCHPADARLLPMPNDECCKHWACDPFSNPKIAANTESTPHEDTNAETVRPNIGPMVKPTKPDHHHHHDKKPIDAAFYPTFDGKPPTKGPGSGPSIYGNGGDHKMEKHEKVSKQQPPPSPHGVNGGGVRPQHEHHDEQYNSFIPLHLPPDGIRGQDGGGGVSGLYYNPQQPPPHHPFHQPGPGPHHFHPQQQQLPLGPGPFNGFHHHPQHGGPPPQPPPLRSSGEPSHKDRFDPYQQYDINPNGIPQGKRPPAPTSQSDLFNILGANRPDVDYHNHPEHNRPGKGHHPQQQQQQQQHQQQQHQQQLYGPGNGNGPVQFEHILQYLHHNGQGPPPQHGPPPSPLNSRGPPPPPSPGGHPQQAYVPIVHSGLPPPPPPHNIAIVDGQPVPYAGFPVVPGLGSPPPPPHIVHQQKQHQQEQQQQQQHHQQKAQLQEAQQPHAVFVVAPSTDPSLAVAPTPTEQGVLPMVELAARPPPTETGNPADDFLQQDIRVFTLTAINPRTVRVIFSVPQVYVNLHGRVELRYTNGPGNDTNTWKNQIFAPPEDLIATPQMEFELPNLEPNSLYKVKITLLLNDLNSQPTSEIYTVKTPAERTITPPPPHDYRPDFQDVFENIEDPELNVSDTNSTWLALTWKKLPEERLQYVDGVQLRYKELTDIIYSSSPLIHRTLTGYTIENLQPDTGYEIGLYYIPLPGHGGDVRAGHMIKVRTAPRVDVYAFDVTVNVTKVKAQSVEVSWNGVPYPEDKFVNIYRAIYQSDAGKEDSSVFKVAKRDSTTGTLIMDLKPGTKYRLWLEMYLTNGNIKKSNVVNFLTKPGGPAIPGKTGKLLTAGMEPSSNGDYYGPLVVVSVVAALAIMSTLVLLLILTRRRVHQTASITPPRKNDAAAYDNPSYKVEIQQETMNLSNFRPVTS